MRGLAIDGAELLRWQQEQFAHDQRNHTDIICLSRIDRLKHYGLHFAKYAGRVARDGDNVTVLTKTMVDAALVMLSAANALSQRLDQSEASTNLAPDFHTSLLGDIADAGGRFCDACEKIDHMEDFLEIARQANLDVLLWVIRLSARLNVDLHAAILERRQQLSERQFFIP